jgi:hypothetical protein
MPSALGRVWRAQHRLRARPRLRAGRDRGRGPG